MKKNVFMTVVLLSIFCYANAQIEEKMEKEGVQKCTIFKDGQEIEGYMTKKGFESGAFIGQNAPAPWQFQGDIKFIPKDVFENTEKIKGNMYKKYSAKDISGYSYEGNYYEAVKYADMTGVSLSMFPKWMFMKRVIDGPISAFFYYDSPGPIVIGKDENDIKDIYRDCAQEMIVYRKGKDGKLKAITRGITGGVNIDKDLEDCPLVKAKLENKEYDVDVTEGSVLEGSKLGALANKLYKHSDEGVGASRLAAIKDYNTNCAN